MNFAYKFTNNSSSTKVFAYFFDKNSLISRKREEMKTLVTRHQGCVIRYKTMRSKGDEWVTSG